MEHQPIDSALSERDDMRAVLARRDVAALYEALKEAGVSQRRIAALTGQSQSEVSEILKGRRVENYRVLERIAQGLGIPRHYMGLGYGVGDNKDVTVADPDGVEEMLRRHLLALGVIAAFGAPVRGLGQLSERDGLDSDLLPSRLSGVHVAQVRELARVLGESIHVHGSNPPVSSSAAEWATRLLTVPGPDQIRRALLVAVAELDLIAGWDGLDAVRYPRAMYHYGRALELATEAQDPYLQALALTYAGIATRDHGHLDDGLKMLQLGQVTAQDIPPSDTRRDVVVACSLAEGALALSALGSHGAAATELAKSRDLWLPGPDDTSGDPNSVAARLGIAQGRWDQAEPLAVASVRRWQPVSRLASAHSAMLLATIHVQAGEPDGPRLAYEATTAVSKLSSIRARARLEPLAKALDTRRGTDARDLARQARQVAATRP